MAISGHGRSESIKRRKESMIVATREHPCRSASFGVLQGQASAARLPPVCRAAWDAENVLCDSGVSWLNPRPPFIATQACRRSEDLDQSMRVSSTPAPDQDDQAGAKGASTNDIKHQQAPLNHYHYP